MAGHGPWEVTAHFGGYYPEHEDVDMVAQKWSKNQMAWNSLNVSRAL